MLPLVRAFVLALIWQSLPMSSHAGQIVAGVDGKVYTWGNNSHNLIDTLEGQGTVLVGKYLDRAVRAIAVSSGGGENAAVGDDGNVYLVDDAGYLYSQPSTASGGTRIVPPTGTRATSVSSGLATWVATLNDGRLFGWGRLFNQDHCTRCAVPRAYQLPNGHRAVAVAAGTDYALAITELGGLYVIGSGPYPFGSGHSTNPVATAVNIPFPPGERVVKVAAGESHALAITASGFLYVWGANSSGQLGTGDFTWSDVPHRLVLPSGRPVEFVAAGPRHSIAVDVEGVAFAWGDNSWGQLGDGTAINRLEPVRVDTSTETRLREVFAVDAATFGRTSEGKLLAWGGLDYVHQTASGNLFPILGPRADTQSLPQSPIALANGGTFVAALLANGDVYTRGRNDGDQLANGNVSREPQGYWAKSLLTSVETIRANASHGAAITSTGAALEWGDDCGQSAPGSGPRQLNLPIGFAVSDIATYGCSTIVLGTDGRLFVADATSRPDLRELAFPPNTRIVMVASSNNNALALAEDGRLFGWGANHDYSLASVGGGLATPTLLEIPPNISIAEIAAGTRATLVLTTDGRVYFRGRIWNRFSLEFVQLPIPDNERVTKISTGGSVAFVSTASGKTYGAGSNQWGEVGAGYWSQGESNLVPVQLLVGSHPIKTSDSNSIVIDGNGDLRGWGQNYGSAVLGDFRKRSPWRPDCAFAADGACALSNIVDVHFSVIGPGQIITAGSIQGYIGGTVVVDTLAEPGYGASASGCGATVSDSLVTARPTTTNCSVTVAFTPKCSLDVDADGSVLAATDGVLLLRALLGFRGAAFAAGMSSLPNSPAVDAALARINVPVNAHLLDVDGDGQTNAITDGLLVVRAMLGLTGDALVAGLRSTTATRTANEIVSYLQSECGH